MNTFFKLVGGIAICVVALGVLYSILHALLAFAVAGVVLVVFGGICLLAVVGVFALINGSVKRKLPPSKLPRRNTQQVKNAGKQADQALRDLERKLGR